MDDDHGSSDIPEVEDGRPSRIGVSVEVLPSGFLQEKDAAPEPLKVVEGPDAPDSEEDGDEEDQHATVSLALGPVPPIPIDGEESSPASPAGIRAIASPFEVSQEIKHERPAKIEEKDTSVAEDAELGVSVEVGSERDSISREMVRRGSPIRDSQVDVVKEESERASAEQLDPVEPDSPTEGSPKVEASSPVIDTEIKEEPESPVEPEQSPSVAVESPREPDSEHEEEEAQKSPVVSSPVSVEVKVDAPVSIEVSAPKVAEPEPEPVQAPVIPVVPVVAAAAAPIVAPAPEKPKKFESLVAPLADIREGSSSKPEASASKPAESKSEVKEQEENDVEGDDDVPETDTIEVEKPDPLNKTGGVKEIKMLMETGTIGEDEIKPRAKASSIAKLKSAGLVARLKGQAEDSSKPKEEPKPVPKPATAGVKKFPKVESEPPKEIPKTKPVIVSAVGDDEMPDPGPDIHRDQATSVQKLATKSIVSEKLRDPGHITPLVIGMPGVNPLAGKKKGFISADGGAEPVAMDGTGAFKVMPMAPDKDFTKKKLVSGESAAESKAESKSEPKPSAESPKEKEPSKPSAKAAAEPVVPVSPKSESEDSDIAEFKEKDKDKKIESKSSAKPTETIKEEPKAAAQPEAAKDLKKLKVDDDEAAPKKPAGCCIVM